MALWFCLQRFAETMVLVVATHYGAFCSGGGVDTIGADRGANVGRSHHAVAVSTSVKKG